MVEIGQTVMCTPGFSISESAGLGSKKKVKGIVVYIHPAGRFYIAELWICLAEKCARRSL